MSTYSAIAALLGGISDGQANLRARQIQEGQLAQQEADRQRQQRIQDEQMAAQRADMLKNYIAGQVASGNNQGAAATLPQFYQNFNQAAHTNLQGPAILGALKTVGTGKEQARPAGFVGPMPEQTKPIRDFSAPGTDSAILRAIGVTPPRPSLMEVSAGASLYDPSAKKFVGTAPVADNPYKLTAEQQIQAAKEKLDLALRLKEMGINAQLAAAVMRAANKGGGKGDDPIGDEKDLSQIARNLTGPMGYDESPEKYQARLEANLIKVKRQLGKLPPAPPSPPPATYPGAPLSVKAIDAKAAAEYAQKKGIGKHGFLKESDQ
jgi:hypothetical protein